MTTYANMSGPELVTAYNALASAIGVDPVERFSDRKAGIRRCETLSHRVDELKKKAVNGQVSKEILTEVTTEVTTEVPAEDARTRVTRAALADAHVKEIEAKSATVTKLGVVSEETKIMSKTSKGALLTTVTSGGGYEHAWEGANEGKTRAVRPTRDGEAPTKAPRVRAAKTGEAKGSRRSTMVITVAAGKVSNPKKPGSEGARHWDAMIGKTVGDYLKSFDEGKARKNAGQWLSNFVRGGLVHVKEEK